jgi:DNA polymerase-3 subunit epsilon
MKAGKFAVWVIALYAAVLALPVLLAFMLIAGLEVPDQEVLKRIAAERLPLFFSVAAILLAVCVGAVRWLFSEYVTAVSRLTEQVGVLAGANEDLQLASEGAREVAELAAAVNRLAADRRSLRRDAEARARESRARIEEERNRLAALMSELAEGVLVCNAEGRILLYNERARQLFAGDEAVLGLGRSLFALIDREQVAHAREKLQSGAQLARLVTATPAGRLLKVQAAPVAGEGAIAGMVLTLEDVTGLLDREAQRLALLQALTAGVRSPVANLRAAAENLGAYPDMDAPRRERFIAIVVDESHALSQSIDAALRQYADALKASLTLEDMRAADLLGVARRRLEATLGMKVEGEDPDESIWLKVDSFAIIQALALLCARLRDEYAIRSVRWAVTARERFVQIDLGWSGATLAPEVLAGWETQPISEGSPLTLRDVLERHGAEAWIQLEEGRSVLRFLLPAGEAVAAAPRLARAADSRPEYYDFDLFRYGDSARELQERKLADLTYTVFDTETTGLEPSAGDEIISIGAVRIVNARLLKNEVFERLINPRRPLNRDSARVHGIEPEALAAEPGIEEVLPAFHRFCEDTVLVAHNAAFDMRFLELKEQSTGVRFTQPVLDTLLLSAVLHPSLEDHRLEAIAERLGVQVIGRHTALGDALLEAEIFLRLLPLLAGRGIVTLREALEASRQTYYSRLRY